MTKRERRIGNFWKQVLKANDKLSSSRVQPRGFCMEATGISALASLAREIRDGAQDQQDALRCWQQLAMRAHLAATPQFRDACERDARGCGPILLAPSASA